MIIKFPGTQDYQLIEYPAGELQVRIRPERIPLIHAIDKITIQARVKNSADLVALALLSNAIRGVKPGACIHLHIPYLPYARADRQFVAGDCHGLHVFGEFIHFCRFDRIFALDVHNISAALTRVTSFMTNISPGPLIDLAREDFRPDAILLPDAGALNRYAQFFHGATLITAGKLRHVETGALIGFDVPSVADYQRVLIVDDICDGGGTFTGIAHEIRKTNMHTRIGLYATHGIFSGNFMEVGRLHFEHVYTTNSFHDWQSDRDWMTVYDAFEEL